MKQQAPLILKYLILCCDSWEVRFALERLQYLACYLLPPFCSLCVYGLYQVVPYLPVVLFHSAVAFTNRNEGGFEKVDMSEGFNEVYFFAGFNQPKKYKFHFHLFFQEYRIITFTHQVPT